MATTQSEKADANNNNREQYDKSYKPYVVFVCSTFIVFIIIMASPLLGIIYVEIMREFQAEASEAALMQSLFRGISFGGSVLGGVIIRWMGEFPCMMVGSIAGCICFGAAAFSQNLITVVLVIGVGAGSAFVFPLLLSFTNIGHAFPPSTAPRFMSFLTMGGGLAMIVTPYLTHALINNYGWRGSFLWFCGIFFLLVPLGIAVKVTLPPADDGKKDAKKFRCSDQTAVYKYGDFIALSIQMVLYGMFGYVEVWFLPDFLVSRDYSKDDVALLLTIIGVFSLIGRVTAGLFDGLFRRSKIIFHWSYMFGVVALAHAAFPFFVTVYPILIVASVVFGLQFGLFFSQMTPIAYQTLPGDLYATGIATIFTLYGGFTTVGGYICGYICDSTGKYDYVFYVSSLASLVCGICSLVLYVLDKTKIRKDDDLPENKEIEISVIAKS